MSSMDKLINVDILNHLGFYFEQIYRTKLDLEIHGVKGFNSKSQFVEGKVVNACSYVYECLENNTEEKLIKEKQLIEIINIMAGRVYETWGILNCISALNRLKNKKLLNSLISQEALAHFKEKLDWRTFVNTEDLTLIDKPTNYYGVAFGIAKYRELLGFEDEGWSEKLLEKLLNHVDSFSGEFSFMDETNGHGRFDRYSILIPAEICSMLYDTGCSIPKKLTDMLKKSCNIFLQLSNNDGKGISYGRSIGAYGDSATMEVLSIGSILGLLNKEEMEIAYSYCNRTVERFLNFWIDSDTKSLNMWDKGRRTDDYRNKNRILGENLSLSMQLIHGYDYWKTLGFADKEPLSDLGCKASILPAYSKFKFAEGDYSRCLYIIRQKSHVITLPLINGSEKYYQQTPYLPIPNEYDVFTSTANSSHPNLIPKLIFKDGREAMPIVFIKDIKDNLNGIDNKNLIVNYNIDKFSLLKENSPIELEGLDANVSYTFNESSVSCNIIVNFNKINASELKNVNMEFATFSTFPTVKENSIHFDKGVISSLKVLGLISTDIYQGVTDTEYSTPVGQLNTIVKYNLNNSLLDKIIDKNKLELYWEIEYM